jgi:heme-degrading monooxygenase HmoA
MLAVIFELEPVASSKQQYLDIAADLYPELLATDGFISIERFESLSQPGKLLSLSFWRDEAAISAWRNLADHRNAQQAGRDHLFNDYRLRVAEVLRDYGMNDRAMAPGDSLAVHGQA